MSSFTYDVNNSHLLTQQGIRVQGEFKTREKCVAYLKKYVLTPFKLYENDGIQITEIYDSTGGENSENW